MMSSTNFESCVLPRPLVPALANYRAFFKRFNAAVGLSWSSNPYRTRGIANDVIQRMIFGPSSEMIWWYINLVGSAELTFTMDDDCANLDLQMLTMKALVDGCFESIVVDKDVPRSLWLGASGPDLSCPGVLMKSRGPELMRYRSIRLMPSHRM
ncbi:hypothetical protein Tco_0703402 [Tanacetum coccineum]|uniref:Uncharacterized protein n=1 Tax=Tanacetum coccineum TaxID=301880 RepID=A0ABQ4Y085_9ASTR